ncbi:MAG: alpha/beta hydrolase [Mesorhizobium amorphae]|nr:MAG: alpha/beta hydrolase [Mesorhizobium amorphae]
MPIPKLLATALAAATLSLPAATAHAEPPAESVVLLHGATMDAASWRPVYDILTENGVAVTAVQLPLTSLEADVAAARLAIGRQKGDVVLVGHSYGGAVATVAGIDPKVRALVYVAAFQPEAGESLADLNARWPMPGHPVDLGDSTMIVDPAHYAKDIAADLPTEDAAFLAASQKPTAFGVFTARLPAAAWHDKPSFAVLALEDRTIDPKLQRFMAERSKAEVVELAASHVPHLSHPEAVADLILEARQADR